MKEKRYPKAVDLGKIMKTHGTYAGGWPRGAVVHYTSGGPNAVNTIQGGVKDGYAYLCIDKEGKVYQAHDIDEWGYHAGASSYPGLNGTLSDECIGIEMNNGSELKKQSDGSFKTEFGAAIDAANVRHVEKQTANQKPGYYEKYTPAQEEALVELLLWLKAQAPEVFDLKFVVGHDEIAPTRRSDPGGALSMTMPDLREKLKASYLDGGATSAPAPAPEPEAPAPVAVTAEAVKALQAALNGVGVKPPLKVDGLAGPKTEAGLLWASKSL